MEVAAGWLPDESAQIERYWDGKRFTGEVRLINYAQTATQSPAQRETASTPVDAETQQQVTTDTRTPEQTSNSESTIATSVPTTPRNVVVGVGIVVVLIIAIVMFNRGGNANTTSTPSTTQQSDDTIAEQITQSTQTVFSAGIGTVDEFKPGLATTPIEWMACDKDGAVEPIEIRVNYANLTSTATAIIRTAVREVTNDLETATNNLRIVLGADYTETPTNTKSNQRAGRSELRQIFILFAPDGILFLDHDRYPDLKDKNQGIRRRWHDSLDRIQAGYIQIDPTWISNQTTEQTKLTIARQLLRILGLELVDTGNEMLTVSTKTPGKGGYFTYIKTNYQYGPGETTWLENAGNTTLCK